MAERSKMDIPGFWTQHRCVVCQCKGFRKIKRIGGDLIGWCRKNHPQSLEL